LNGDKLALEVYPNPTDDYANIAFHVDEASDVELKVLDMLGAEVSKIVNQKLEEGNYIFKWDDQVKRGTYLVELTIKKNRSIKRLVVIK